MIPPRSIRRQGFTLVEVLVVIAILSVLAVLGSVAGRKVIASAKSAKEINAARQLVAVYVGMAADDHGTLPAGIDPDTTVSDPSGNQWPGYVAKRYPARMAEALDYRFEGTVCVNEAEKWADDFYSASVAPSFGINATFVGGSFREPEPDPERDAEQYGDFCIRTLAQADDASRQLVFASARTFSGYGEPQAGNFYVRSPYLRSRRWASSFKRSDAARKWGNVDPRHPGQKAVVAFLDGTARLLGLSEQEDMRYWAKGARLADDPQWVLEPINAD